MRLRTQAASRIHAEIHGVGLHLARGRLLTREGRAWVHTRAWPLFGPEQRRLIESHEAMPIERFSKPKHLVSYAGLAPRSSRSGMRVRGPIPAGAKRWLRNAFVQTVVVHCRRAPESWLSQYYDQLKARLDWRTARVASARKQTLV